MQALVSSLGMAEGPASALVAEIVSLARSSTKLPLGTDLVDMLADTEPCASVCVGSSSAVGAELVQGRDPGYQPLPLSYCASSLRATMASTCSKILPPA